jgi:hypothetical protein
MSSKILTSHRVKLSDRCTNPAHWFAELILRQEAKGKPFIMTREEKEKVLRRGEQKSEF